MTLGQKSSWLFCRELCEVVLRYGECKHVAEDWKAIGSQGGSIQAPFRLETLGMQLYYFTTQAEVNNSLFDIQSVLEVVQLVYQTVQKQPSYYVCVRYQSVQRCAYGAAGSHDPTYLGTLP